MKTTTNTQIRRSVCALAILAWSSAPLAAQPRGNIRSTTLITVKPDRVGDFQAAVKEYTDVLKKAKWDKSYTVWRSLTGPREYRLTVWTEKWAELDTTQDPKLKDVAANLAGIGARISQCEEKSERIITEVLPDISMPREADPPKMIRILRSLVRADKIDEYLALVKSDIFPAAKKAGVKTFSTARTRYGGPTNEIVSVTGLQSWGDLDSPSPIVSGLGGPEAYAKFLAKVSPLLIRAQNDLYSYQADLSYTAAK